MHVFYFSSSGGRRGGQRGCCDAACETSQHSELPQEVAAQRTAKIDRKCHLNVELLRLSLTVWSCGPVGANMQNKLKKSPQNFRIVPGVHCSSSMFEPVDWTHCAYDSMSVCVRVCVVCVVCLQLAPLPWVAKKKQRWPRLKLSGADKVDISHP